MLSECGGTFVRTGGKRKGRKEFSWCLTLVPLVALYSQNSSELSEAEKDAGPEKVPCLVKLETDSCEECGSEPGIASSSALDAKFAEDRRAIIGGEMTLSRCKGCMKVI